METLWNVYVWHNHGPAIRVGYHVTLAQADAMVQAYLNRGVSWDAYMVQAWDDPGD